MKKNILVSVLVPVYNVASYIKKCLNSIINQSYLNLEIILVDDGSTDNSGIICDEYAQKDNRVRVIHQKNGGLACARKSAIGNCNGELICFVDSDDWIEPNMIEEMVDNIISTNSDFVHTGTIIESNGQSVVDCRYEEQIIDNPKENKILWKELMAVDTRNYINRGLARKLFKRQLVEKCYLKLNNNISYGEDFITVTRCILECNRVSFIKKAYYHYNIREGAITNTKGIERIYMHALQFEELRKIFIEYNMYNFIQEILEKACSKEIYFQIKSLNKLGIELPMYSIKNIDMFLYKKVIIYGAGKVGYEIYNQLSMHHNISIEGWIDSYPENSAYREYDIKDPKILYDTMYDVIVIAVKNENIAIEIKNRLKGMGIEEEKIFWEYPCII